MGIEFPVPMFPVQERNPWRFPILLYIFEGAGSLRGNCGGATEPSEGSQRIFT